METETLPSALDYCKRQREEEESTSIQNAVDDAIRIIAYHTDVVIHCPCGSGEVLTETDGCPLCQDMLKPIEPIDEPFANAYDDLD